jgi:hypothetical protein
VAHPLVLSLQIRHNLVVPRSPSFVGAVVS